MKKSWILDGLQGAVHYIKNLPESLERGFAENGVGECRLKFKKRVVDATDNHKFILEFAPSLRKRLGIECEAKTRDECLGGNVCQKRVNKVLRENYERQVDTVYF